MANEGFRQDEFSNEMSLGLSFYDEEARSAPAEVALGGGGGEVAAGGGGGVFFYTCGSARYTCSGVVGILLPRCLTDAIIVCSFSATKCHYYCLNWNPASLPPTLQPHCYTLTLHPNHFTCFRLKSKTTPRACHDIRQRTVGAMQTMWTCPPCLALSGAQPHACLHCPILVLTGSC